MAAGGVSDDFDVEAWNPEDVAKYFSEKGLQTFAELCEPNDIDGTVLINTSHDELRNLGLTFGIAKKVLLEIRKLKPCESTASKKPRIDEDKTQAQAIMCDAVRTVATQSASTFAAFSTSSSTSWVNKLDLQVYIVSPLRWTRQIDDDDDHPYITDVVPISLLCEEFGAFLDVYTSEDLSLIEPNDMKFIQKFIFSMACIYETEEKRNAEVLKLLMRYFNVGITADGNKGNDGILRVNQLVCMIFEGKNEPYSTNYDPEKQCLCYYSKYLSDQYEVDTFVSNPCIFLIISGPNISIVGVVNGKSFVLMENLVPTLRVAFIPGSHISNSLCFCFKALKLTLNTFKTSLQTPRGVSDFPHFTSFEYKSNYARLEYSKRLMRLVYLAQMTFVDDKKNTTTTDVIVKFTNTYGEKVHRLMADNGYAPELFKVFDLKPNWKVVIMEYKNNLIPVTKNDASQIRLAICVLHENEYVHGDLRSNNIFKCDGNITIIDFDWSGTENEVRYPLWINCEIEWPTDVTCGALITKQHDTYWIDKLAQ